MSSRAERPTNLVAAVRRRRGWSQVELAQRARSTRATIQYVEASMGPVLPTTRRRILRALGVPIEQWARVLPLVASRHRMPRDKRRRRNRAPVGGSPGSLVFDVVLPVLPPMNTAHTRRHWRAQWANSQKLRAALAAALHAQGVQAPGRPMDRARLTCIRYSSSEPDVDNLAVSFKPLVDGLTARHLGFITDDKPSVLAISYQWRKAPPRHGRVQLVLSA